MIKDFKVIEMRCCIEDASQENPNLTQFAAYETLKMYRYMVQNIS